MSTTDELLEEMLEDAEEYATPVTDDDLQFWIDEHLRVISIPKNGVVAGVEGDKNVNKIKFGMNRYYHGFDMSTFSGRILYSNAKGNKNYYNITDMQASGSAITFSWLVDADAVQYMGKTAFVVYLFKIQGSELRQKFYSTLATLKVLEGMEVDSAVPVEKQTDIIERMKEEISAYAEEVKKSLPADYTAMTEQVSSLKEDLTKISEQKAYMDGVTNLFNWIRGSYTVVSNRLAFNADNEYAISTPIAVSVKNASYIKISDFETYKYSLAITYGTDNWFYLKATSNPFEIPKNVTGLVISVGRRDNEIITGSELTSVGCTIISDNEFDHLVALTELFSMPKTIKSVIENTQTNTSADAFLLNENISMDTNTAKGLFSKKIGGIGSITFTDWLPAEQLSNTFNVQQDDDYIYKCMHFPHDGTYPNLQYQDPNIIDVESLPFKLPIGAIYVNTDVAEEFNGLIRIVACNLFGYKKGHWYEIDNRNIKWAQIYSLPWGTSDGTNIKITYQDGTALINLANNKLTKNNTLHFGTYNTYATEFDYYIVKVTVRCNKDSCGLKVGVDSRDNISGSPTQIIESRTFALTADTTLTAVAHNIPDSVYSRVITNFDNYVRLKVPHYYCGVYYG